MISKLPKKAINKWNRFDNIEQGFIVYCIILIVAFVFLPIIKLAPIGGSDPESFYFINKYMRKTDLIILILFGILILWNTSFRFKRIINLVFSFKENDALLNFILLLMVTIYFLSIGDIINLLNNKFTAVLNLAYGYYVIGILLIIGIIWNLFLALNLSKSKKRSQIVNIMQNKDVSEKEKDKQIKGLFEVEEKEEKPESISDIFK